MNYYNYQEKENCNDIFQRKNLLINKLNKVGLELRSGSKLCQKYIEKAQGNVDNIVERMCQMKYLYDYCNIQEVLNKLSKERKETVHFIHFPYMLPPLFEKAENIILEKQKYPKYWPWQVEKSAKIIQKGCYNWIAKPITKDNKLGILLRLGLKHNSNLDEAPLYLDEI